MTSAHKLTPQGTTPMANRPMGWLSATIVLLSCSNALAQTGDPKLVERGRQLFFNETFEGNGRTCGTCHPATNNFTIDPAFVRALPRNDPLFVIRSTKELRDPPNADLLQDAIAAQETARELIYDTPVR